MRSETAAWHNQSNEAWINCDRNASRHRCPPTIRFKHY
jgi:hypothetical protein